MPDKIPYFNAPIYLQNKSAIGKVDEILGPINEVYFSVKMGEGMVASSFKKGDKVYIAGDKLLPLERFLPKPKISGGGEFKFNKYITLSYNMPVSSFQLQVGVLEHYYTLPFYSQFTRSRKGERCWAWRTWRTRRPQRSGRFSRRARRPGRRQRYAPSRSLSVFLLMFHEAFPEGVSVVVVRELARGGEEGRLVAAADSVEGEVAVGAHIDSVISPVLCYYPMFCGVFAELAFGQYNVSAALNLQWIRMPSDLSDNLSRLRVLSFQMKCMCNH